MRVLMPSAVAAMVLAITACAPVPQVQTVVAPDAGLDRLRTFRVVLASNYLGDVLPGETSPTFLNSTTGRELGKEIAAQLEHRGFTAADASPDVLVEYGTAVKEEVDATDWDYNYLWRPKDWRGWGPGINDATPAEYSHGAVVIDMVDARTGQLLWRGHEAVDPTGDPRVTMRGLDQAVATILDRFPGRTLALAPTG
jgi:Domain of unknown function (DUF4136)